MAWEMGEQMQTHPEIIVGHHFGPFVGFQSHCGRCVVGNALQPRITVVPMSTVMAANGHRLLIAAGQCSPIRYGHGQQTVAGATAAAAVAEIVAKMRPQSK